MRGEAMTDKGSTMIGRNTIVLNHATMTKAIQHYFETVLFKDEPPKVVSVDADHQGHTFKVEVEGPEST